jgi:hypothetical protein
MIVRRTFLVMVRVFIHSFPYLRSFLALNVVLLLLSLERKKPDIITGPAQALYQMYRLFAKAPLVLLTSGALARPLHAIALENPKATHTIPVMVA